MILNRWTTEGPLPPQISHRRLLVIHGSVIVAVLRRAAFASLSFGVGVLFGGVWRFANYFWQRNSTRAIFESAARGETPVFLGGPVYSEIRRFGLVYRSST